MNLTSLFSQAGQSLADFWAARVARERVMLAAAAAAVVLGLYYALLIAPALTGRGQLNKNLPELRQQVAQLQALAKEAAAFSGNPAPPVAALSEESIKTALAHKGLKPQSVALAGGAVKVTFNDASFAALMGWLDDMQKNARFAVSEAHIVALAHADRVNAVLTLRTSGNE